MAVMSAAQFVQKAKDIATKYKTLYVMGCFGAPLNAANKKRYTTNYAYNKRPARTAMINAASSDTFGFDCVCLIKGILWGWNGNVNASYGGAQYGSNGVPDFGTENMLSYCAGNGSANFSDIQIGEVLWMKGHAGIYIGDGLAVECTPIWKNGVQITAVGNIGKKAGYNTRTWTKHGKIRFIDYAAANVPVQTPAQNAQNAQNPLDKYSDEELAMKVLKGEFGNGTARKKALGDRYAAVQKIVDQKLKGSVPVTDPVYHKVVKGDTLSALSKKYGTTVEALQKLNNIKNANVIILGQKIRVK